MAGSVSRKWVVNYIINVRSHPNRNLGSICIINKPWKDSYDGASNNIKTSQSINLKGHSSQSLKSKITYCFKYICGYIYEVQKPSK